MMETQNLKITEKNTSELNKKLNDNDDNLSNSQKNEEGDESDRSDVINNNSKNTNQVIDLKIKDRNLKLLGLKEGPKTLINPHVSSSLNKLEVWKFFVTPISTLILDKTNPKKLEANIFGKVDIVHPTELKEVFKLFCPHCFSETALPDVFFLAYRENDFEVVRQQSERLKERLADLQGGFLDSSRFEYIGSDVSPLGVETDNFLALDSDNQNKEANKRYEHKKIKKKAESEDSGSDLLEEIEREAFSNWDGGTYFPNPWALKQIGENNESLLLRCGVCGLAAEELIYDVGVIVSDVTASVPLVLCEGAINSMCNVRKGPEEKRNALANAGGTKQPKNSMEDICYSEKERQVYDRVKLVYRKLAELWKKRCLSTRDRSAKQSPEVVEEPDKEGKDLGKIIHETFSRETEQLMGLFAVEIAGGVCRVKEVTSLWVKDIHVSEE